MNPLKSAVWLILLAAMSVFPGVQALAQSGAPNLKLMETAVKQPGADCFWPELKRRYEAGDSSLSITQKRCLYFGYSLQPEYSGYGSSDYEDSIRTALKHEPLLPGDYGRILLFTDSVFASYPFSLRNLAYRRMAARALGNTGLALRTQQQLNAVADAIESTGDGKSSKTAYWVISVADEYSMLARQGLRYAMSQSLVDGPCDKLSIEHKAGGQDAVYFNVSILMNQMEQMFSGGKDDRKKKR